MLAGAEGPRLESSGEYSIKTGDMVDVVGSMRDLIPLGVSVSACFGERCNEGGVAAVPAA